MRAPTRTKKGKAIRMAYTILLPAMQLLILIAIVVILLITRDPTVAIPLLLPFIVESKLVAHCMLWYSDADEREFLKSDRTEIPKLFRAYLNK